MITDAEPAKKREAEDILGAPAKNNFIEQEKEIANLKSKCQSLNSTVSAQTETIKSQEQKLLQ